MTAHYYGVAIGAGVDPNNVATGTSTTSKSIELVVTDGVTGMSKNALLLGIEAIKDKIIAGNEPA
jgi:hypothetical protein